MNVQRHVRHKCRWRRWPRPTARFGVFCAPTSHTSSVRSSRRWDGLFRTLAPQADDRDHTTERPALVAGKRPPNVRFGEH